VEPEPGRGRRVAAGVVGIALFVAVVWVATTGGPFAPTPTPSPTGPTEPVPTRVPSAPAEASLTARVGFIGLPPEGAVPSRPRTGELVLSYHGRRFARWYQVWVYRDGRLIWLRDGDVLEGANEYTTGFLEQRLSPKGIRLLLARGSAEAALFGIPWRPPYPASWLPPRAWEDREIRAFVPSRWAVCYQGLTRTIAPSRIVDRLPPPAVRLLRAGSPHVRSEGGWLRGFDGACSVLTTEDAHALVEALEEAGLRQDEFQKVFRLAYYVGTQGPVDQQSVIWFEPILPHGVVPLPGG